MADDNRDSGRDSELIKLVREAIDKVNGLEKTVIARQNAFEEKVVLKIDNYFDALELRTNRHSKRVESSQEGVLETESKLAQEIARRKLWEQKIENKTLEIETKTDAVKSETAEIKKETSEISTETKAQTVIIQKVGDFADKVGLKTFIALALLAASNWLISNCNVKPAPQIPAAIAP